MERALHAFGFHDIAMSVVEFALWATLGFLFWKKGLQKRFPALSIYLALRAGTMPVLLGLLYVQAQPWGHQYFPFYFYPYWAVYIASAISLFFVTLEIFRSVLSPFSGLMRLGTVVFRWVALVSAVASLGSISYTHPNVSLIPDFALALMRSVSILELCLLAFLWSLHQRSAAFLQGSRSWVRTWFRLDVGERSDLRGIESG